MSCSSSEHLLSVSQVAHTILVKLFYRDGSYERMIQSKHALHCSKSQDSYQSINRNESRFQFKVNPTIAVVLGSGLHHFTDLLLHSCSVLFADIPGMPITGVKGHEGRAVVGDVMMGMGWFGVIGVRCLCLFWNLDSLWMESRLIDV